MTEQFVYDVQFVCILKLFFLHFQSYVVCFLSSFVLSTLNIVIIRRMFGEKITLMF